MVFPDLITNREILMEQASLNHGRLRRRNRARVLLEILRGQAPTRTQIAESLGLSVMGVARIVRELMLAGLVEEGAKTPLNSVGRPGIQLSLNAGGAYVIGLSINAYEPSISLANLRGEVILRRPVRLSKLTDGQRVVSECPRAVRELISEAGVSRKRVLGLGTVVGGVVNTQEGVVLSAPFLGWGFTEIAAPLHRALGIPVVIETLDNALLLAEVRFGIGAGKRSVLFFRSAAGLGGSLLIDGRLIRGAHFKAGQIGHMRIKGATRVCSCGQAGCLNTVSSGGAVFADLGLASAPIPSSKDFAQNKRLLDQVVRAAMKGDRRTNQVLFRAGRCLAEAVLGLVVAVDAEQVLLAGPLSTCASYRKGFESGLAEAFPGAAELLSLSTMDHCYAAALLALSELVLSDRLAFGRLQPGNGVRPRAESRELVEMEI